MSDDKPRRYFIIVVGFSVFLALFWRRLLFNGLIPFDFDTLCFYLPNWAIGRKLLRDGAVLWDPYRNFGQAYLAVPQNQALYPLRLLSLLLTFDGYTRLSVAFHTAWAFFFMIQWARRRGAGDAGAATAALAFSFGGPFFMRVVFAADFATIAWLPCLLYLLETRRSRWLAAALALQWFAGYPPLFLVGLAVLAVDASLDTDARGAWKTLAVAALWGAALAAVQAIPFLEMMHLSSRDVLLGSTEAVMNSTHPLHLLRGLLLPSVLHDVFPQPLYYRPMFYVGPFVTGLAVLGAWRGGRRGWAWLGAAALFFWLALGRFNGVTAHIGALHVFRYPGNWVLGGTTVLAVLASQGVACLKKGAWQAAAVVIVAVDLLLFAWPLRHPAGDLTFVASVSEHLPGLDRPPAGRLLHAENILAEAPDWNWRTPEAWPLLKTILLPSYGTVFGLREGASHHNLTSRTAQALRWRLNYQAPDPALLAAADIDRIVTIDTAALASPLPRVDQFHVLALKQRWGRAFVLAEPSAKALVDGAVTVGMDRPGQFIVTAEGPGRLVFSEGFAPGWQARIDGVRVPVQLFDEALMSISLEPGRHAVSFLYRPASFTAGLALSLAALAMMLALGLNDRRRLISAKD